MASGARAVELDFGRISVRGAALSETTIAVHRHQRSRTLPPLPIERIVYPGDPVGLIRVHNGDIRDFVVLFD